MSDRLAALNAWLAARWPWWDSQDSRLIARGGWYARWRAASDVRWLRRELASMTTHHKGTP